MSLAYQWTQHKTTEIDILFEQLKSKTLFYYADQFNDLPHERPTNLRVSVWTILLRSIKRKVYPSNDKIVQ